MAFENKKKTELGLSQLVNIFEVELHGDRAQLAALSNFYFRSMLNFCASQLARVQSSNKTKNTSIKDKKVQPLHDSIEKKFNAAIIDCCKSFSSISEPIVPIKDVNLLVEEHKSSLPEHYNSMMHFMGFD